MSMTPEAMRVAIAWAAGYKMVKASEFTTKLLNPAGACIGAVDPIDQRYVDEMLDRHLPDYLNDLNAMHEAEKALTPAHWPGYLSFLEPLCQNNGAAYIVGATAEQRAEAFLKSLSLWKDQPAD